MDMESDWSSLPADLLVFITSFLLLFEDFMVLRGVCTSWRAAVINEKFESDVPLLMLAGDSDERQFYSLSKRKICTRISIPDIKGKRCMDVDFGWILGWADSGEICLLKPFSSARFQLPSFKTFPEYEENRCDPESRFIKQAWLTTNPSEDSSFNLLVKVSTNILGFWRNGDQHWSRVNHRVKTPLMTCAGEFIFILDLKGKFIMWDTREEDLSNPQGPAMPVRNAPICFHSDYLVHSTKTEVLVITRNNTSIDNYLTGADSFRVMRLDLADDTFKEINDLGKDAVFLGNNASVSVDTTDFPGVLKPNCIYFTDDVYIPEKLRPNGGGKDMGIYNVEDQSIERFEVESCSVLCPPMWVFPSF